MQSVIVGLAFGLFVAMGVVLFMRHSPGGVWSALSGSLTFVLFFAGILVIARLSDRAGPRTISYRPGIGWGVVSCKQASILVILTAAGVILTAWLKWLGL